MRHLYAGIFVAGLLLVIGCESSIQDSNQEVFDSNKGEIRIYEVFGMDCPGCQSGLEKLVNKIPGIETSQASWKEKRLSVLLKEGASVKDEEIYDAIRRANFTHGKRLK
jgi:copper chaperone CopZ